MSYDVLSVGDPDRLEDAALAFIRGQLERSRQDQSRRASEKFLLAAVEGVPWVGAFVAAAAALKNDTTELKRESLHALWLEQHESKLRRLRDTLENMRARFEEIGGQVLERIDSQEYLDLVRKGFRAWDQADTDEKRRYIENLLTNAGGGARLASDDVVRLFIEWIETYHESHFAVIREVYQRPRTTRLAIWRSVWGSLPREDSAEADLYRRLIRDLSTGGVIRQDREVTSQGDFVRRQPPRVPKGTKPSTLESSFDDEDPYVLTALGQQFVHYTMNEVVQRIAAPQ